MSPGREQEEVTEKDEWDLLEEETEPVPYSKPVADRTISIDYAVAQFMHYYPGEFKDGQIYWKRFWALYAQLPHLTAIERVNIYRGNMIVQGLTMGSDDFQRHIRKELDDTLRLASGQTD